MPHKKNYFCGIEESCENAVPFLLQFIRKTEDEKVMRATRHNGRAGKHGAYNPKHNDRDFDVEHADHIDTVRAEGNVYWDCYQGYCLPGSGQERQFTFSEIEKIYYQEHYGDHIDAQNERNEAARHPERNRSAEDVLKNTKTCPEETILQLGNIDGTISASTFAQISAEYFEEFEKRFGSHIHILDWALHLDESTPHIHERHVFDAENRYGEICPQQDKALEELGFELPDPEKPKGRYNNRKMSFDAECRNIFLEICKKHGIEVEMEPVYGGVSYLEKADYIVQKLREENAKLTAENQELKLEHDELVVKVSDLDALVENVSEIAYEKACEVLTKEIAVKVREEDITAIEDTKTWLSSDERKAPKEKRDYAIKQLAGVQDKLRKLTDKVLGIVRKVFEDPQKKKAVTAEIVEKAKPSIREMLEQKKKEAAMQEYNPNRKDKGAR